MKMFFALRSDATQALHAMCSKSEALARFNTRGAQSRLPKAKAFGVSAFLAITALALPLAAHAQQVLTLKSAPSDGDGRVTVGDVFDNAGAISGVVLGYRSGATVILDAATVQSVVGANGGYWDNPRGLRRITVSQGADGIATVQPAQAAQVVRQPANPFANMPAPPPASVPVAAAPVNHSAVVVRRAELIDVTWSANGLSLTMSGVAQKDAATGDLIQVQNPSSKKMIDAVITGPGHAMAGPAADRFRNTQLSSR